MLFVPFQYFGLLEDRGVFSLSGSEGLMVKYCYGEGVVYLISKPFSCMFFTNFFILQDFCLPKGEVK